MLEIMTTFNKIEELKYILSFYFSLKILVVMMLHEMEIT